MTYPFTRKIKEYLKKRISKGELKPLILRGARQVGKTAVVRQVANELGLKLIELNFEKKEDSQNYSEIKDVSDLRNRIRLIEGVDIAEKGILLFIDEIQGQIELINLLRYIYEQFPNLAVVAAGSLLEFYLKEESLSFPVGRVEYVYMGPLDFLEFLYSIGEEKFADIITNYKYPDEMPLGVHEKIMRLYGQYILIGGMPEAVEKYINGGSLDQVAGIQKDLLQAFADDIPKYAQSKIQIETIMHLLNYAPHYAGKVYKYQGFASSDYKSREMKEAFATLERAGLVYQIAQSSVQNIPLEPNFSAARKLGFLDVGLVNASLDNHENIYDSAIVNSDFTGSIVEQSVLQQLRYGSARELHKLFRWVRDTNKSAAEVDFLLNLKGKLTAIEVKSGATGRLGSLFSYSDFTNGNAKLVRLYGGLPKKEELTYAGREYTVNSLPLYLVPRLWELI